MGKAVLSQHPVGGLVIVSHPIEDTYTPVAALSWR
jgi:hypothetical protein